MKIILILIVLFTILSCSKPADLDAIQNRFETTFSSYEQLTNMVTDDFQGEQCFSVGTDNIGKYWEFSGKWTHANKYETKLELSQVLQAVAIEKEKYDLYLELFAKTETERITFCPPSDYYIMAHRSGLAVSGCLLDIVKGEAPPSPYGKRNNGEDFMEVITLRENWWMEYKCT